MRDARHGWLYGTNDFACSTAWQTVTFNQFTNPYAKTLPNLTGIVDLPFPGDYRAGFDGGAVATTANVREVRLRLMLAIDGAAYAEVPGSDTLCSIPASGGIRLVAAVPFVVPLGQVGAVKWEISASNADVVLTTTLNPDASGAPAAPTQAVNRRMLVDYLGTVR